MITAAELVAEARAEVRNLDVEQFARDAGDDRTVVVDLREADERVSGTIPGAIHVPRGMLEFRADPSSPYHDERIAKDRRILLHCASGGRSALAARALLDMGYSDVAHLDGGMEAWRSAGRPVVNDTPAPY
jgi:rhodanese-related sulfurtransferase